MIRFIHITKTGGRSIIDTTNPFIPTGEHPHHVPFQIEDLDRETFGVVRNPYDRVESLYNFYKYKRDIITEDTIKDFVLNYDYYHEGKGINHPPCTFKTCFDYLSWEGEMKTKHILRFENLQDDWKVFASKFNLPLQLKHSNINNTKESEIIWDDDMKEVIQRIYNKDFTTFNYNK